MDRDEQVGKAVTKLRGEMSQSELAERMRRAGWKWSQSTVWALEKGDRALKYAEAYDLVRLLGADLHDLLGDAVTLDDQVRSASYQRAAEIMRAAVREALNQQLEIASHADELGVELPRAASWMQVMGPSAVVQEELLRALARTHALKGGPMKDAVTRSLAETYTQLSGMSWESMRPLPADADLIGLEGFELEPPQESKD